VRRLVLALAALLAGCQTHTVTIDGRRVLGTEVVNGELVYLVESKTEDRIITRVRANESREAAQGMVFKPTKAAP